MPEQLMWEPDVSRGEWLRPMESEPFASILSVVPRGFEAYARIFHAVERDRPRATGTWHGVEEESLFAGVTDIEAALETGRTTWAEVAAAFGTTMHSEAQYARLVGLRRWEESQTVAPDGWRYDMPPEGSCDPGSFTGAARVLARHTTTPSAGVAAVWEGWGGLMSSEGYATYTAEMPDPTTDDRGLRSAVRAAGTRLRATLRRALTRLRWATTDRIALFHRDPEPGTGLLSREIASGPTFALHGGTGRTYVLFQAGADDFTDPAWGDRAPWVRPGWSPQTPSMVWPDDHAWFLATEIDWDSTLVAGSAELVRELVETPGLEVLAIDPDARLTSDGDTINPAPETETA